MIRISVYTLIICTIVLNANINAAPPSEAADPAHPAKIIFSSSRTANYSSSIYSINPDGTNQQQLSFHDTGVPASMDPGPISGGNKIIFTRGGGGSHRVSVWQLDLDKKTESQLTGNVMVRFNQGRAWASIRPGHQQFIFVKEAGGARRLTLASFDDSPEQDLGLGEFPCWSPDGSQLAFVRSDENGSLIWVMTIGEDDAHPITDSSRAMSHPNWSPLTNRIVVTGRVGDKNDLFVVDLAGGGPQNITGTPDLSESLASWSPDEKFVAFAARSADPADGWQKSIYVLDLATGAAKEITSGEFQESRPTWVIFE